MLVKKTNKKFIFEAFEACDICTVSFDLWMARGMDTFVLIVHFFEPQLGAWSRTNRLV
jgi:hypothetical protein